MLDEIARDLLRFRFQSPVRITGGEAFVDVLLQKRSKAHLFTLRAMRELVNEQAAIAAFICAHENSVAERHSGNRGWPPAESFHERAQKSGQSRRD